MGITVLVGDIYDSILIKYSLFNLGASDLISPTGSVHVEEEAGPNEERVSDDIPPIHHPASG